MNYEVMTPISIWVGAYLLALGGSGVFVRQLLAWSGRSQPSDEVSPGRVIGKLEDVLVVSLVAAGQFTALALIFAAKGIARAEIDQENASYYILGTLGNFTWALLVALAAKRLITLI